MAKVSIIIPVCNVAEYLEATLDSLVNQTLRDVEILCYDDCSEDESGAILDRYAAADDRVKVVHYTENKTAAQARKDGALAATGEYIMYVDGDDTLQLNACEELAALMDKHQVDMIHFGTTIEHDETVPEARAAAMERMVAPYKGKLTEGILEACFVEGVFHFQIWNKIYRAELVKRAMENFPDGRFSKAQDAFAFYLIAFFAQSYLGIPERSYYVYGFGRGVTGHQVINRKTIVRYADQALVSQGVRRFLEEQNAFERYEESWTIFSRKLLNDSMVQVVSHVAKEDVHFAFEKMCERWGIPAVIGYLAVKQGNNQQRWAGELKDLPALQLPPRKVKRIGTFYHSLRNGGAQRVVAELANIWAKMGYEVTIFTDTEPTEEDYEVAPGVERVVIAPFDWKDGEQKRQRALALYNEIRERKIDLFVHQAWNNTSMLWDMLCAKLAGSLFYIHCHNVFSMPLLSESIVNRFFSMPSVYAMADGIMALSETDACYWRHYNSRVFTVVNPLTFDLKATPVSPRQGKNVLWLGRIASEKFPVQAVEIFNRVLLRHPDATMQMVGSGPEGLENAVRRRVEDLELQDKVELCGFTMDVDSYYMNADVFLCTSLYEGAPLTIQEAQSHGLPCVVYDMPYLMFLETGKGSLTVPTEDKDAAAEMICQLLDDRELLHRVGDDARENIQEICLIDFEEQWARIIASAEEEKQPLSVDVYEQRMLQTMTAHMQRYVKRSASRKGGIRHGDGDLLSLYAAPMPERGPLKTLRKKVHTFMRILALDGLDGVKEVLQNRQGE